MELKINFTLEKETKGAVRYQEVAEKEPTIGTLYLRKWVFGTSGDYPKNLTVIVKDS